MLGTVARQSAGTELRILYICPTHALVRGVYERLAPPLEHLGVALSMKSGDTGPVSTQQPPTVLITTPKIDRFLFTRTRATAVYAAASHRARRDPSLRQQPSRGDHLRCLLRRIEQIRRYHQQETQADPPIPLQRIALSATIVNPAGVASRYLVESEFAAADTVMVQAGGGRHMRPR